MSSLPLRGRLALVTGVGGVDGIGFAVAQALARDGARVAITSTTDRAHQRAGELTAQGAEAVGWVRDLTDRAGVRSLLDEIHTRLGRVEVLVNNAGMTQTGGAEASALFHELAPEQWDRQIAITLTSAFNVTRELVNDLIGHGWGRIVTVSSVTGPLVSYPGQSAYAAAKAGLEGLTRSLAVELGQYGITVNSVAPGWIETGSVPVSERRSGEFTPVGLARASGGGGRCSELSCPPRSRLHHRTVACRRRRQHHSRGPRPQATRASWLVPAEATIRSSSTSSGRRRVRPSACWSYILAEVDEQDLLGLGDVWARRQTRGLHAAGIAGDGERLPPEHQLPVFQRPLSPPRTNENRS